MTTRFRVLLPASLALAIFTASFGAGQAAQTIVGVWRQAGGSCQITRGAVSIGPMHMGGDEWRCDFHDVDRKGDVVTWKGKCGFPEPFERAVVKASLVGQSLYVRINGGEAARWERCR